MEANEFYKRLEEAQSKITEMKDSVCERLLKNLKDSIDELPKFFEEFYKEQENSEKKKNIENSFEKILENVNNCMYQPAEVNLSILKEIDFLCRVYELIIYLKQSLDKIYPDFPLKLELINKHEISELIYGDSSILSRISDLENIIYTDKKIYRMLLNKENIFNIIGIVDSFTDHYNNIEEILGKIYPVSILGSLPSPFKKQLADYFVAIGEIDLVSYLFTLYRTSLNEKLNQIKFSNDEKDKKNISFFEEQLKAVEEWENENAFLFGKKKIQPTPLKQ
ncbi:hypothetical protein IT568_06665 [bacterium]|nr:hypothetical protein [bacterium]